jgi:hypothetical protein
MTHEIVSDWRKSSYSDSGANCVETASVRFGQRAVRDSKDTSVGHLVIAATAWTSLTAALSA